MSSRRCRGELSVAPSACSLADCGHWLQLVCAQRGSPIRLDHMVTLLLCQPCPCVGQLNPKFKTLDPNPLTPKP